MFLEGVAVTGVIRKNARFIIFSSCTYFVVQLPATIIQVLGVSDPARYEGPFACLGAVLCFVLYFLYISLQGKDEKKKKRAGHSMVEDRIVETV